MQLEKKREKKKECDNGSQEWKSDMHSNANMTTHHPHHTVSVGSQSHNSSKQHTRNTPVKRFIHPPKPRALGALSISQCSVEKCNKSTLL